MNFKLLRLHPNDNVAVALADLPAGVTVDFNGGPSQTLHHAVPFGHKVALAAIAPGGSVVKYGEVIGYATAPIERGAWVHLHNVESVNYRKRDGAGSGADG